MKIVSLIARILLGAVFVFAGSNHLFNFFGNQPLPPGVAGQFVGAMIASGYLNFIGVCEILGGLLLLVNQFVPLGLTVLGPIVVNILVVNALIMPKALPAAFVLILLWILGAWPFRPAFFPLLRRTATD
ncbi:MAG: DoxX family membrane protein [Terracidiphilus sp.]